MKKNPIDKAKLKRVMTRAAQLRKKGIEHPLKKAWAEVGSKVKPCPGSKIKSKGKGRGKGLGKGKGPRGVPFHKKAGVSKKLFGEVAAEVAGLELSTKQRQFIYGKLSGVNEHMNYFAQIIEKMFKGTVTKSEMQSAIDKCQHTVRDAKALLVEFNVWKREV